MQVYTNELKIPLLKLPIMLNNALKLGQTIPKEKRDRGLYKYCTLLNKTIKTETMDNGVGFNPSDTKHRKSFVLANNQKRLNLLWKINQLKFDFSILNSNKDNISISGTHLIINLAVKKPLQNEK
jgi:LytS/YehU family sensor histidine kinase